MALVTRVLPLTCLMLLLLQGAPGVGAQQSQSFQLLQPQDKVSVTAGGTLTLTCTTTGYGPPGPVQWLKDWGSENKTIYDDETGSLPRLTRVLDGSNSDFSIHIRDVQPEDAGTYYCVKFRRLPGGGLELFEHGRGTEVSVYAKPSQLLVSGPRHRAMPRQSVPFDCTAGSFPEPSSCSSSCVSPLCCPILWLGMLLEKGLLGGLLIFLFKRRRT